MHLAVVAREAQDGADEAALCRARRAQQAVVKEDGRERLPQFAFGQPVVGGGDIRKPRRGADVRREVGRERVFALSLEEKAVERRLRLGVRHLGRAFELFAHEGVRRAVERKVAQIAEKVRRVPGAAAARREDGLRARKEGRRLFEMQAVTDCARLVGKERAVVKEQIGAVHAEREGVEVLLDKRLKRRGQGFQNLPPERDVCISRGHGILRSASIV